jgi:undecaprenyl phosphate N,N'-diacetylbacillosamine 1-phosphate transferase
MRKKMYQTFTKRMFDFLVAFFFLLIFSPIFIVLIIILSIANRGAPFFLQKRPGKGGRVFFVIKFKTMNDKRDRNGDLLLDKDRLTVIGKFIRKTSLDEIPQMINVMKGEMSLVGPRPLLVEYLSLYNENQIRRHEVLPGITGWAQVNGRNAISWEEKFEYDVWYVDNLSFWLDIKILVITFFKVIKAKNVSAANNVTTDKFKGTR